MLSQTQGHSAVGRIISMKKSNSATFRFVEQCLNHPRHRVLLCWWSLDYEEVPAHWGLLRHGKNVIYLNYDSILSYTIVHMAKCLETKYAGCG